MIKAIGLTKIFQTEHFYDPTGMCSIHFSNPYFLRSLPGGQRYQSEDSHHGNHNSKDRKRK